ncbi:MAG: hypothetical protein J3K34DRAFT_387840 [Monoraphidium minutum]|nr:MAG: hypothetical protein J3K34DRAFT_387840 [Monoraphidium minutum]
MVKDATRLLGQLVAADRGAATAMADAAPPRVDVELGRAAGSRGSPTHVANGARSGGGAGGAPRPRSPSPEALPLLGKGPAAPGPPQRAARVRHLALLAAAAGSWFLASSGAIIVNKTIMVDLRFPYPSLVSSLGMVGSWAAAAALCRMPSVVPPESKGAPLTREELLTRIVPTGLLIAVGMYLGGAAYLFLSVAFIQMLKALTPVATMLCGFALGTEKFSPRLCIAVAAIAAGVAAAARGELRFSGVGFFVMLGSILCEALRLNVMQLIMGGNRGAHPFEALRRVAPATAVPLLVIAAATEAPRILASGALSVPAAHPWHFALSAAAGFGVNAARLRRSVCHPRSPSRC